VAGWLAATAKVTLAASATACSIFHIRCGFIAQHDTNRVGCINIPVLPLFDVNTLGVAASMIHDHGARNLDPDQRFARF
jgi:hypothetical protein